MMRVLHVLSTLNVCGGIENFVMNYYRAMDRGRVQFDFLIHDLLREDANGENFIAEAESLGARVYRLPAFRVVHLTRLFREMDAFYRRYRELAVLHCHMANAAAFHFFFAGRYGHAVKILHSHQPAAADRRMRALRDFPLLQAANAMADARLAASEAAGRFLFGKQPFRIVPNAVDAARFRAAKKARASVRQAMGWAHRFVVGHVGRFEPVKNHAFLLEVMERIYRERENALLCLVGDGARKEDILRMIRRKRMEARVVLLPPIREVDRYYGAFDFFLLPSLFEGFGMAAIEAQYAGVPVLASEGRVPREAKIDPLMTFLPLEAGADAWARHVLDAAREQPTAPCGCDAYDARTRARGLERWYLELEAARHAG